MTTKRLISAILFFSLLSIMSFALDLQGSTVSSSIDSKYLEHPFKYKVYLPVGYSPEKKIPVLYLLHGSNGNENSWDELLPVLDSLVSSGEIIPFAAVIPCSGYSWWVDGNEKYESAFINELIPQVEKKYGFSDSRSTRAIAGFSMGGYGALRYALVYPNLFRASILLSPALYDELPPLDSSARETGNFGVPFNEEKWTSLNYPQALEEYKKQKNIINLFIAAGDDDYNNPEGFKYNIEQQAVKAYGLLCKENKIPGELRILNGGHGTDVWKPAFAEGLRYIGTIISEEMKIIKSKPADKTSVKVQKLWEFEACGPVNSSIALGDDGTLYFGCDGKKIYAVDHNGNKKWEYDTNDTIYATPAIGNNGIIYFASWDGFLYAITENGTLKWKSKIGAGDSSPCIGENGDIYIGSSDGKLICLDENGNIKWEVQLGSIVTSSPVTDGKMIYIASEDNKFFAFSAQGKKLWEVSLDSWITSSPSFYYDDRILLVSGSSLFVIDRFNGGILKKIKLSGGRSSAITDKNGNIYVGTREDKKLYAFDKNFEKIWDVLTGSRVYSTALAVSNGLVLFGSRDNSFYCIDSKGNIVYEFKTKGEVNSSPIMDKNGTVYFGSADSKVYALRFEDIKPEESLWPMFRGNNKRDGRLK